MGAETYVDHLKLNKPTIVHIFDEYVPASAGFPPPN